MLGLGRRSADKLLSLNLHRVPVPLLHSTQSEDEEFEVMGS